MASEPALKIDHLNKSFDNVNAVGDLSLSIEPGEIFGLLGPNGAGKSTTINCVVGVTRFNTGKISVFGYDTRSQYRITRRLIGVMHQEVVTDHFLTIDEALKIHAGYYGYRTDDSWRRLLIERLGLGPHLGKSMNKLSGGLKRRFMVAKAMIHKPPLLILDEPTAGVDVELRHSLWNFVREINQEGTTVLLTTHYLEEAEEMCGRIGIMNHGELIALDRTDKLIDRLKKRSIRIRLAEPLTHLPEELLRFPSRLEKDGYQIVIEPSADTDFTAFLPRLFDLGLSVSDIETGHTRLEDVFMELTGLRSSSHGEQK